MPSLQYLTVQDILWINLQITKKVQHFSFAKLEEATFYQYAYGGSNSLLPPAARFLIGFARLRPFEAGNAGTAFVGCLAFLHINGATPILNDADSAAWLERLGSNAQSAAEFLGEVVSVDEHAHGEPDIRAAVREVLEGFPTTLVSLAKEPTTAGA